MHQHEHHAAQKPVSHEGHDMSAHQPGGAPAHDKHAGHRTSDFLSRFWISLVITIPILLLSEMIQHWAGFHIEFPGHRYVLLALGTVIYLYGGWPFLTGMVSEIKHKALGMMTLVALAITVAWAYSVAIIFGLPGMDFFWELATLVDIMLLGHWLEMRSQQGATNALQSLVKLLPSEVHIQKDGKFVDLPLQELQENDTILVKPGEKIPADGLVTGGSSYVNESMITGESVPVKKETGAKLIGGSLNGDGQIEIKVTGTGKNSYLQRVIHLVETAQNAKSKTQNLADRVAKWLTIISIIIGVATFIFWYTSEQNLAMALERLVTVMVTACPHALGIAIPLVVAISTTRAATQGLLVRNRTAFEDARKINTIIFDKTGTLTKGTHEVQQIHVLDAGYSTNELLQYAAAVQQSSEHYIARGIMRKLEALGLELWPASEFKYTQGVGVEARVKGKGVVIAGPSWFKQHSREIPVIPEAIDQQVETISFIMIDGKTAGLVSFADTTRESAAPTIAALKDMHIRSFLLTGDNEKIAGSVAQKLGMDGWRANVLPHEKQEALKEFQEDGSIVAMTGDGVNDAPALAQAHVGIAIGSGTDVAGDTADVILVNSDPMDVVHMIRFAKATYRKMIQNLFWAVGYNVIAIPLAAGILYPRFVLSPALGAVLMSLSTIIVAFNAQLLKKQLQK